MVRYEPKDGELMYHYCSPNTLLAILQHRSFRLTDVSEMNDSLELRWGIELLRDVIKVRDPLTPRVTSSLDWAIRVVNDLSMVVAGCFSTKPDVLSQWRAYSDNGAGFCIGFDPKVFVEPPVNMRRVFYSRAEQEALVTMWLDEIAEIGKQVDEAESRFGRDGDEEDEDDLIDGTALRIVADLAAFKNQAFSEEQEIRLVHLASVSDVQGAPCVEFLHASEDDGWPDNRIPQIGFMMRGSVPVCYLDIPITHATIKEVVIGPRALVTDQAIARLLGTLGFRQVRVRRSEASYR